jgi:hypothetical protein
LDIPKRTFLGGANFLEDIRSKLCKFECGRVKWRFNCGDGATAQVEEHCHTIFLRTGLGKSRAHRQHTRENHQMISDHLDFLTRLANPRNSGRVRKGA